MSTHKKNRTIQRLSFFFFVCMCVPLCSCVSLFISDIRFIFQSYACFVHHQCYCCRRRHSIWICMSMYLYIFLYVSKLLSSHSLKFISKLNTNNFVIICNSIIISLELNLWKIFGWFVCMYGMCRKIYVNMCRWRCQWRRRRPQPQRPQPNRHFKFENLNLTN